MENTRKGMDVEGQIAVAEIEDAKDGDIDQDYTAFSPSQRSLILYGCSIAAIFSTLSSFIYFPAITAIARSLQVSIEKVDLTITSYQVVSGIAPSIFGCIADEIGRRPVLLFMLLLYLGANIGLALTTSYTSLLILRCLQSAGASSSIAIAYGIIADISVPANRGSSVGVLHGFTNATPSLGPVVGGIVSQKLSWRWIFWLLGIASGTHLLALALFLPETARNIVGNGSLHPAHKIHRSVFSILFRPSDAGTAESMEKGYAVDFLLPLESLIALKNRANFIAILAGGVTYTIWGCLAASLSTLLIEVYSLNYLAAGFTYLPAGVGGLIAALATGKLLDHDYRVIAHTARTTESEPPQHEESFPIEKARLRSIFPIVVLSSIATAGYGWALQARTHIAALLVIQFVSGAAQGLIFVTLGTLITDLNPQRSSTVQASYNLIRCALSAAGMSALEAMIRGVGVGWCFTIFATFGLICLPLLYMLKLKGESWRRATSVHSDVQRGYSECEEKQ